ncbi:MAG: hypothetical protein DHS20C18_06110 [Saprospiraceae bacterium]|nr:MAG: hypothetical protein DHS20C18_06110 [Saprospiraceae bacterium]
MGYFALLGLLVLAGLFYQERTLFIDIAYQTFLMINEGTIQVQVYRFGAAIVQALPLLAIKLELPLRVVLLLYSISFPLVYLLFYWVIVRVLRNDYLGLSLVFVFTLITFDGFYWATSELQQGLAFLLVTYAFVRRYPALDRWWQWAFLLPAMVAIVFYHPLVFIPFYFLWGYYWLSDKSTRHLPYFALAALMAVALLVKSKVGANWYDDSKYDLFYHNWTTWSSNLLAMPSNRAFLKNCLYYWYGFPLLFLVITIYYLRIRQWWKPLWITFFCLGYIFLVNISSPEATYQFYAEVNYMPLVIFVAVPFLHDLAPKLKPGIWQGLLVAYLLLRLGTITWHHQPYSDRLAWLRTQLDKGRTEQTTNRYMMPATPELTQRLGMTWGVAYETLLLSSLDGPENTQTLVVLPDPDRYKKQLAEEHWFISELIEYPVEEIDGGYYRLGLGRYVGMRSEK